MYPMRQDHTKTEEKYRLIREAMFEAVTEEFPGVRATPITRKECHAAESWKNIDFSGTRPSRGVWDWGEEYFHYEKKPNRFEIALYGGGQLCALSYGQTSVASTKVRMDLIESIPLRPSPLGRKALPVLSFAAATFAELVGATEVWVIDPFVNLESVYQKVGFGERTFYHGKRIGQRRVL